MTDVGLSPNMTSEQVARLARDLGPAHPLVTLANEFSIEMSGKFPPWCCSQCGRPAGWLGRLLCGVIRPHYRVPT